MIISYLLILKDLDTPIILFKMLQVQSGASTPKEFWTNSAFTYKIYFAFTLVTFLSLFTLNLFYPGLIFYIMDIPQKTIWSLQIWRLLTSLFGISNNYFVILNFIFGMIWLGRLLNVLHLLHRIRRPLLFTGLLKFWSSNWKSISFLI